MTWKRRGQCDHKGRGWSAVTTRDAWSLQKLQDPGTDSLLESLEGVCSPADILILDFWPP